MQPRISPAMSHNLISGSGTPNLTVYIWDSHSTGTDMFPPPWSHSAYGYRGEIAGYNTENIYITYQLGDSILRVYDRQKRAAVYWTDDAGNIPYWESGFPLRDILHWWLIPQPFQLMHAGAVGLPQGGVIIAGKGGSGKSTTSLACLNSDLVYAGDDYILARTDGCPVVYSLYNTGKVNSDTLARLPFLKQLITNPDILENEKALIYLSDCLPQKLASSFPLKAVFVPHITQCSLTQLRKVNPSFGLSALAPTTLMQLPRGHQEGMHKLAELVRLVPNYVIELGTDLNGLVEVILDFLRAP